MPKVIEATLPNVIFASDTTIVLYMHSLLPLTKGHLSNVATIRVALLEGDYGTNNGA